MDVLREQWTWSSLIILEKSKACYNICSSRGAFCPQSHIHKSQVKNRWINIFDLKIEYLQGKGLINGKKVLRFTEKM